MNYYACALCGDVHHRDETVKLSFDESVSVDLPDPAYVCEDCYQVLTFEDVDGLFGLAEVA